MNLFPITANRKHWHRTLLLTLYILCITPCIFGQPALMKRTAEDAYTIVKMATKFHVQPRAVNDSFSRDLMWLLLHNMDEYHTLYKVADIDQFKLYSTSLDEEIGQKKTGFLQLFIQVTEKRLRQEDSLIKEICRLPVDFFADDAIDLADTSYPAELPAMRAKLAHLIKYEMLQDLLDHTDTLSALPAARQKKFIDSIEISLRKRAQVRQSRQVNTLLQSAGGVATALCNEYCKTIAVCFDPHTAYFPLTEKENFESDLGNQPFRFGFKIDEAPGGGIVLSHIEPGSPAFKSGLLNEGDKLLKLQWQGSSAIDVSDADIDEVGAIFSQSNHATLTLSVKKVDGSIRDVPLVKAQVEATDEENRVRSFVLKGSKTIGYIALPAFYSDWDDDAGANGCANDVGKEIMSLLKQNISGLIIDLRYNGGGSLREATELAGIFIDAGPVEQIKRNDAKILTLKDVNRGTIYSGPLVLLVNGYSASASEMLAGTLQDYKRAIIAGSPTYGKATGQLVLPLDTTINFDSNAPFKETDSYLKLTTSTLYRITGATPQGTGVIPDIALPDILEAMPGREKDEYFWLHTTPIEANKYFRPLPAPLAASLKQKTTAYADTMQYFVQLRDYISKYNQLNQEKKISLKWSPELLARDEKQSALVAYLSAHGVNNNDLFTVDDASAIKERLQVDTAMKDMYDTLKSYLEKDASVRVCFRLLCDMAQ